MVIMDNNLYSVTICAVIFGVDETLINIDIGNGFIFKRMSLIPSKDHLNEVFETDAMGLRRDYEDARIGEELNVICVFKSYRINLNKIEVDNFYKELCDDVLEYLDNKIRVIRLLIEGPIRFKKLSINMKSEVHLIEAANVGSSYSCIIPIGEAMGTREINKLHCDYKKIKELNYKISSINFPITDPILNTCHKYYDLSYHQEQVISITLLITCLEILFLDSEKAKREKLSKRCSVFLYDNKNERLSCYVKLHKAYKKRSKFVHDGDFLQVKDEDIIFLRECVRESLIKYLNNKYNKKDVIRELKETITSLDYWENNKI